MSRLRIETPDQAQLTVERLYKNLERHIIASPPGLCPVDLQLSFLKVCHAQTCGKCVPCRVGLAQLQNLMEDVLAGKADMHTLDLIESTAQNVANSADCAIGFEAAKMVLAGLEGFREDYINHIKKGKCSVNVHHSIPCVALCPAQVDIPGYIALVGAGRYADAVKLIRKDNPFPTACGLICEHPCEARCRRSMIDAPINIRGLKRMAVDNAPSNTVPLPEKQPATNKRIAIIGGGPSGMSAAYYLELMGHHAVVFEEKSKLGGMLRYGIPAYRFPRERLQEDLDAILSTGVEVHRNTRIGNEEGDIPFEKLREEFDAVYIAIGAHTDKKIGIEGEDSHGVISAVEMLRNIGEEKMPDFKDKTVVVIGGGNAAIDVARAARRLTKGSVNMYCLEKDEEMPTVPDEKNAGLADGVVINNSWAPKAILGESGKVTGIELMRCVSVRDASGKFAPVYDENETITVSCSNVLVAIGQRSEYGAVLAGTAAETPDGSLIDHNGVTFQTEEADIFVGGDCATGPKYTIDAIASGREGAVSIHRYVNVGQTLTIHRNLREFKELDKQNITLPAEKFKKPARAEVAIDQEKVLTMQDDRVTFTEEQIKSEASRCLSCGRSVVDPNKCIGCGICTTKCEFDAIHLKRNRPQNSKMIPAEDKFKAIGPYAAKRQVKIIKKKLSGK